MRSLLFLLLLCTCVPAIASAASVEPLITRSAIEDENLKLTLANLEQERTIVQLSNLATDEVVFSERVVKHNGYRVNLCLEKLDNGRYVIAVKKGETLRQQVILKTDAGIMCSDWK